METIPFSPSTAFMLPINDLAACWHRAYESLPDDWRAVQRLAALETDLDALWEERRRRLAWQNRDRFDIHAPSHGSPYRWWDPSAVCRVNLAGNTGYQD
jgi:hypothetical protein